VAGVDYFAALQFLDYKVKVKVFRLFGRGFGAFALGRANTRRQYDRATSYGQLRLIWYRLSHDRSSMVLS